jgi:hypothetical protein
VTGHDADLHCTGEGQCHYVEAAVNWVRAGAPDPSRPVLVLDRLDLDFVVALDNAFGPNAVPREVVDPRSAEFAAVPLTTDRFSAILIASDVTCGGCDLNEFDSTPDSDAINARQGDIAAFFNAGGGVYANSGADHGDGNPDTGPDPYYSFLPIPVGGTAVSPPFCLTPVGASIGFEDPAGCPDPSRWRGTRDDINCCATHNSFTHPPPDTALQVAETDVGADGVVSSDDVPETLVAEGVASGGRIISASPPPPSGQPVPARRQLRLADLPNPELGTIVNVQELRGQVLVGIPAHLVRAASARPSQKGITFVPLSEARQIPVGSFLDNRRGTVRVQSARDRAGTRQNGDFSQGLFQVLQSRRRSARGLTDVVLKGASFSSCRRAGRGKRATAAASIRRRLRANARGRFRTRGRHSAATVRGTAWLTADRCDGTLTKVTRGKVAVRDFRRRKTVVVRAGKSYLARARR